MSFARDHRPDPDAGFMERYEAGALGILHWEQLDALWATLRAGARDDEWYVYAVGEAVPQEPVSAAELDRFLTEVDALLRADHDESYCGIVYVDDRENPRFVKIFDPNNLGSSCGSSGLRVLPGWILSTVPPEDLQAVMPPPKSRRRWWQRLFP